MTEEEWLLTQDLNRLCDYVRGLGRGRKRRLLDCECAQHLLLWADPSVAGAVERAYQFADGQITKQTLVRWYDKCESLCRQNHVSQEIVPANVMLANRAVRFASMHPNADAPVSWRSFSDPVRQVEAVAFPASFVDDAQLFGVKVIRDIFGNPFRPVVFDPSWRSSTAIGLAAAMYESRDFAAMPILADALEEAGCDHPDILAHCRDEGGVHVRGCWVVDLLLGKV